MPPIPGGAAQFISTGVNMRPTFFGCNLTQGQPAYPIIIYLPNAPPLDGSAPATKYATCPALSKDNADANIILQYW